MSIFSRYQPGEYQSDGACFRHDDQEQSFKDGLLKAQDMIEARAPSYC
jgi:hypothetical protein